MAPVRQPGELYLCSACGEALIALLHERTGTPGPITVATYPNGNIQELPGFRYKAYGPEPAQLARDQGMALKLNHFANCPNAIKFKRKS